MNNTIHIFDKSNLESFGKNDAVAFKNLNLKWLQEYNFTITNEDQQILDNPYSFIINNGIIVTAKYNERVIGCVALSVDKFLGTISKLSVDVNYRQMGLAVELMKTVIETAKHKKIKELILFTNKSKLQVAFKLYVKLGFKVVETKNQFERCETKMNFILYD